LTVAASLLADLREREHELVALLAELVRHESPSADPEPLEQMAELLGRLFAQVGEVHAVRARDDDPPHLVVDVGGRRARAGPLILCHYDTVWPRGTTGAWPFTVANGIARGPGVLDMKAGIAIAHAALSGLIARQALPRTGVRLLLTADEEIGNPSSRDLVTRLAREAAVALVPEPPLPGGALKTQRKGHGSARISIAGRAAHAGINPEEGVNAVLEAARVAIAAADLARPVAGTTVNVGSIEGGGPVNVLPDRAVVLAEFRADTDVEMSRVADGVRRLATTDAGATVEAILNIDRPPMPRGPCADMLLAVTREVAGPLGLSISEGRTGGGSEGNFAQAAGTPTLDGLGALGGGAHTRDEQVVVSSLPERAALLAGLVTRPLDVPRG
jgi:glutamate carboxypeptidase